MSSFVLLLISVNVLLIIIIIDLSSTLPLRPIAVEKRVEHPGFAEKRELILCWVVQIHTHATRCGGEDGVRGADGCTDGGCRGRREIDGDKTDSVRMAECCSGRQQIGEHVAALSDEVGLEIQHTFGQFHDHFLLCHTSMNGTEKPWQKNPPFTKSKSDHLRHIHRQHSALKTQDRELFEKYKQEVEWRLRRHEEILWFSSEHVHLRHSRAVVPPHLDLEMLQSRQTSEVVNFPTTDDSMKPKLDNKHDVDQISKSLPQVPPSHQIQNIPSDNNLFDLIPHSTDLFQRLRFSSVFNYDNFNPVKPHQPMSRLVENDIHRLLKFKNAISEKNHQLKSLTARNISTHNIQYIRRKKLHKRSARFSSHDPVAVDQHLQPFSKRSAGVRFNDPYYPQQWHLHNRYNKGMDINVTGVWEHKYTGQGVTVSVVDDGIEWRNPDLKGNYNSEGSWDMNDDDPDPTPDSSKLSNHHGTRCAGEVAAIANNAVCGVGVAYGAQISGLRVLDGVMTDSLEAEAFNKKLDINDIYSCSWGPDDDGKTVDGPHIMAAKAMKYGVDFGRRGYGSIFVVASGNGGEKSDNCNFDGYANSIYTVTIGAVDEDGRMPYYAEECASMLGVTFSSGRKKDIVTTDWTVGNAQGCTDRHTGTSAAAPLAAAMIALMLEARPCLTWRDVQYIIILTGQEIDVDVAHWQKNGAGLSHSHKHGFGLLNAWRLVNAARVWKMVPWLTSFSYAESDLDLTIHKGPTNGLQINHTVTDADIRGLSLFILENVQLTITLTHPCRGVIGVTLISPSGTVSVVATPRPHDNSSDGFKDWTFTTIRCWGEKAFGSWTIQVFDFDTKAKYGMGRLKKWRLTLFGTPMTPHELTERQQLLETAMSGEFLSSNYSNPCPPPPSYESGYPPLSDRTLKVLLLSGAFCLLMAVYETLEYMFCYDDEKKAAARDRKLARRAQQLSNQTIFSDNDNSNAAAIPNGATHNGNVDTYDVDGEEDDVFDISETSRLLRPETQGGSESSVGWNIPEAIPLSTFSLETGANDSADVCLPSSFSVADDSPTADTALLIDKDS